MTENVTKKMSSQTEEDCWSLVLQPGRNPGSSAVFSFAGASVLLLGPEPNLRSRGMEVLTGGPGAQPALPLPRTPQAPSPRCCPPAPAPHSPGPFSSVLSQTITTNRDPRTTPGVKFISYFLKRSHLSNKDHVFARLP